MMLKHKLVILFAVFLLVFGFFSVYVTWREVSKTITTEALRLGENTGYFLSQSLIEDVLKKDVLSVQSKIEDLKKTNPSVAYVYIIDPDGKLLAHTFANGFPRRLLNFNEPSKSQSVQTLITQEGKMYDVSLVLIPAVGGELHIGLKEESILEPVKSTILHMMLFGILSVGAGGVVLLFSMRAVLRPIKELEDGIRKIMGGNYGHRLPVFSDDELGALSRAFNKMSEELETRNRQIQEYISKLKVTYSKLKRTAERYKALITSVGDGIITLSKEGVILFWNHSAEELTGIKSSEAVGKPIEEVLKIPAKIDAGDNLGVELCLQEKTGRRVLKIFSRKLSNESGEQMMIVRDITNEVIKDELNKKLSYYEHLVTVGQLAALIAHEVNTPLTGIMLSAELLLTECKDDETKTRVKEIISKVETCKHRIDNILKLARTNQGIERKLVDLAELVDEAIAHCQEGKGVTYTNEVRILKRYEYGKHFVFGDPIGLREVFENIILNAFQAMKDGGKLEIEINEDRVFSYVRISDTGIGIPKEYLGRIFEPFFTTKKKEGCLGLGLNIANSIVKANGGEILVESRVGVGSVFTIKLPRRYI
jgi:PAS domain S-box-containing protein